MLHQHHHQPQELVVQLQVQRVIWEEGPEYPYRDDAVYQENPPKGNDYQQGNR